MWSEGSDTAGGHRSTLEAGGGADEEEMELDGEEEEEEEEEDDTSMSEAASDGDDDEAVPVAVVRTGLNDYGAVPNPQERQSGARGSDEQSMKYFLHPESRPFSRFCIRTGLTVGRFDSKRLTHLLMDKVYGGKLSVPHARRRTFHEALANDLSAHIPAFVCEIRTTVFPMLFDLDFAQAAIMPDDYLVECIDHLIGEVRHWFPNADGAFQPPAAGAREPLPASPVVERDVAHFETIVLTPLEHKVLDDGRYKFGVHVVMPHIVVNAEQADHMRAGVVVALGRWRRRVEPDENPWEGVVDRAAYKGGGSLRMPGCYKSADCKSCSRETRNECTVCSGAGKLTDFRFYRVKFVRRADGTDNVARGAMLRDDWWRTLNACSIRLDPELAAPPSDSGWRPYACAPAVTKANARPRQNRGEVVTPDMPQYAAVLSILRASFERCYASIEISSVAFDTGTKRYRIIPSGLGSSFCHNIGRSHKSRRVYFLLDRKCVKQRCFCRCPAAQGETPCAKYCTEWALVATQSDLAMLFPDSNLTMASVTDMLSRMNYSAKKKVGLRQAIEVLDFCFRHSKSDKGWSVLPIVRDMAEEDIRSRTDPAFRPLGQQIHALGYTSPQAYLRDPERPRLPERAAFVQRPRVLSGDPAIDRPIAYPQARRRARTAPVSTAQSQSL